MKIINSINKIKTYFESLDARTYFFNFVKIQFYFFFIFFASIQSFAQLGGNSTYQFLNLISSPRQAALGGKVITNIDYDVSQALYNPATINSEMDNQLSLNYSNYLGDIGYGTASYAYTFDRRLQTFHIGVIYVDYGNFDELIDKNKNFKKMAKK